MLKGKNTHAFEKKNMTVVKLCEEWQPIKNIKCYIYTI